MFKPLIITILSLFPLLLWLPTSRPMSSSSWQMTWIPRSGLPRISRYQNPHLMQSPSQASFLPMDTLLLACSPSEQASSPAVTNRGLAMRRIAPNGNGLDINEFTMGKPLGLPPPTWSKWHLGNAQERHPTARGFDEFYGLREGSRSYFYKEEKNLGPEPLSTKASRWHSKAF